MDGPVVWPQLVWIGGIVVASAFFGGAGMLWVLSRFQQDRSSLSEKIDLIAEQLKARVHAIELQNAGTYVILQHVEKFKEEINKKLDECQSEQRDNMEKINKMIASVHNASTVRGVI